MIEQIGQIEDTKVLLDMRDNPSSGLVIFEIKDPDQPGRTLAIKMPLLLIVQMVVRKRPDAIGVERAREVVRNDYYRKNPLKAGLFGPPKALRPFGA